MSGSPMSSARYIHGRDLQPDFLVRSNKGIEQSARGWTGKEGIGRLLMPNTLGRTGGYTGCADGLRQRIGRLPFRS